MILAPRLKSGDTIGIVSPSWGGAGLLPHRLQNGIQQIELMGFRAKIADHALNHLSHVSDTPEHRATDLHQMFADPQVKAIVSAIGGDHSCQILPHLDFDLIRRNPKIFMGFSDTTVLNVAIYARTGLVTFNGPALLTDFAEYPQMFDYTQHWLLKTICEDSAVGAIEPSTWWTEEYLDWEQQKDLERPRSRQTSPGWTWLKPGTAEGKLIGGCIESLQHLRGTSYWPDWQDAILFFETSEDKPSPTTIDGMLMDYENMGILRQLRGMLVGRPMYYSEEEKAGLRSVILERTRQFDFPIIADMDFGHTAPQFPLPIGGTARIDSAARRFEILTPAVV